MKLVAVGDNCMDVYNDGNYFPGGNPVNVAVYTVRLGNEASYVGVVGNDDFGTLMLNSIKNKSVDISNVDVKEGKTAVTQVELVDGERVFGDYDEGVLSDFTLSDSQKDFIMKHDLVISGLWGNVHHNFKEFKDAGLVTAFDSHNRPFDEAPQVVLPYVDYFFYSVDDIQNLENLKEEMKKLQDCGPKVIVVMMGEYGSIAYDGKEFYEFGIVPVEVVDTMGAGDSYIAGFLKGIMEGKSILKSMELGAHNASETISYSGAWSL